MRLTNVSSKTSAFILKALIEAQEQERLEAEHAAYELNPADVIKEEDYEESIGDMTHRKASSLMALGDLSKSAKSAAKAQTEEEELKIAEDKLEKEVKAKTRKEDKR